MEPKPFDEPVVPLKRTANDTILGNDLRPITYNQGRWVIALLALNAWGLLWISWRVNRIMESMAEIINYINASRI